MPGVGTTSFGYIPLGSVPSSGESYSTGDFNFSVVAHPVGGKIVVSYSVPAAADAPLWSRELKVLRKRYEWPGSYDDSQCVTIINTTYGSGAQTVTIEDTTDIVPDTTYYYALYELRVDGYWLLDPTVSRKSAYAYSSWGFSDYLFSSLPAGWQRADSTSSGGTGDLKRFMDIFGGAFDSIKSDIEQLGTLYEIETLHADLIRFLDQKIGWPTWHAIGAIKKRLETEDAVDIFKVIGTRTAITATMEDIYGWTTEIVEGWKYVMFSNGLFGCTTPDLADPKYKSNIGLITDYLKYVNDGSDETSWHCVNGLAVYLTDTPGSEGISSDSLSRYAELLNFVKAAYANVKFIVIPIDEDVYDLDWVVDSYEEITAYPGYEEFTEEDMGYTTSDLALFLSNDATTVTNDLADRTFHSAIEYV